MRSIPHFVGGRAVEGTSGRFGDVFDPNTGQVQARVALAGRASWTPPSPTPPPPSRPGPRPTPSAGRG
jgi:hypothetical protein